MHLAAASGTRPKRGPSTAPPMGFGPLQRMLTRGSGAQSVRVCLTRTANAFRFSQPLGASPPRASRPYFIPAPLMGFALQSFAPPAQPYAVSGASSPPDVRNARCDLTTEPGSRCRHPKMLASAKPENVRPVRHTPSSGCCSTRESATRRGWFRPTPARSSPGPSPLQGVLPQLDGRGLHRASPHAVRCPGASGRYTSTPGSCSSRGWLVSLETADPPGVPRLLILHNPFEVAAVRESPPQGPGCVTVPCNPSLNRRASSAGAKL